MTVNLSPTPYQRFVDSNGAALSGGLLYTYAAGTNTPQATYTDSTGATANSNPIVLNSRGEASIWLDPSLTYKYVLQTSVGAAIWTQDNIPPVPGVNDIQTGRLTYLTSVAGTNTITASLAGVSSYVAGQQFSFLAAGANTGAVTININGIGAKAITKNGSTALAAGEIQSGSMVSIRYDGTQFQLGNIGQPASLTNPGDQFITSGLIVQWGTVATTSVPSGSTVGTAVTFKTPFPNAVLAVIPSNGASGNLTYISASAANITNSGFTFVAGNSFTGAQSIGGSWIAFGN